MDNTFGSTCHGAGRAMSRNAAKRNISSDRVIPSAHTHELCAVLLLIPHLIVVQKILEEMTKLGITLKVAASELIAEEVSCSQCHCHIYSVMLI
jgi:hypothetical protein